MSPRISLLVGCALLALSAACRSASAGPEPLPFELALTFEGQRDVDQAHLEAIVRKELARLEVKQLDRAAVDDAAFALELFYRSLGHADVSVEYELIEPAGGSPSARFSISEGPVVRVSELVIEGASALPLRAVRAHFGPAAQGGIYDAERFAAGVEALRSDYFERGHLRVEIVAPPVEREPGSATVALRVSIQEGPVFRVQAVVFEGGAPQLAGRETNLEREHTARLFQPGVERQIEGALLEDYAHAGYPDAALTIVPELDEASGEVTLRGRIVPGDLVTIAHFRIQGNQRTRDATILDLLGIERGARYDSEQRREAFRKLYATGLFDSVELELEGQGSERTLLIDVVEARSVQVRLEPGWGSYEGPRARVSIEENNFRGRGQVLSLEGTASLKAKSAHIGLVDRDFLGSPFTAATTFFVEQREEPSFEFARHGFSFFVRRTWVEEWSSSFGYEFRPTDVLGSTPPSLPTDVTDDTNVALLSASLALDDRDSLLLPMQGHTARARLEWADAGLGSEAEFVRAQLEYTQLFRMSAANVLAVSAHTGLMAPFGSTEDIPLPERFFNGGENSVRSFREDELGPVDVSGEPLGGESATTLNLEYRCQLTGHLAGALFYDLGNVTAEVQDYLHFPDFRSAVGLGLRYLLPIGPLRIDLGVNPDPRDGEDDYTLHFSVGFPF